MKEKKNQLRGHYSLQETEGILVCGHRGDCIHGLENTMTAFQMAVEAGVDMVETDVRMTSDGHLVLMHDSTIDRTTNKTGQVCELTLKEVLELNAAAHALPGFEPESPPTLENLLEFVLGYPDVLLNIELKDYPNPGNEEHAFICADKTAEMIIAYGVQGRTWINSFDGRLLEHVYNQYGKTFHYHGFYPWFILGDMTIDPESFIDLACMQHRYQKSNGEIVKYEDPMCPRQWFDHLLSKGIMPLMAPSLSDYKKYDAAFSWGSRCVNTNNPYAMLFHLRKTKGY